MTPEPGDDPRLDDGAGLRRRAHGRAGAPPRASRCRQWDGAIVGVVTLDRARAGPAGPARGRSACRTSRSRCRWWATATPDEQLLDDGRPLRARRARPAARVRGRRGSPASSRRPTSQRADRAPASPTAAATVVVSRGRPRSARSVSRLRVALGEHLALVVVALALGQADLDLGPPVLEVDAQRHEGQTLLLGLARDLVDLVVVEQQLAAADRVELAAANAYGRMCIPWSHTSPSSTRAYASCRLAWCSRSDFTSAPCSTMPALPRVEDEVVVARLAVGEDGLVRLARHADDANRRPGRRRAGSI